MGYKVYCNDVRGTPSAQWATNGLVFDTHEAATAYGNDLFRRWLALKEWEVREVSDTPNYTFDSTTGAVVFLESNVSVVPARKVNLSEL